MNMIIPLIRKTLPTLIAKDIIGVQPMMSSPIHNKKYWPYQYELPYEWRFTNKVHEVERWCYANFKSRNWRNKRGRYFAFKRHEDYMMFLLRWS